MDNMPDLPELKSEIKAEDFGETPSVSTPSSTDPATAAAQQAASSAQPQTTAAQPPPQQQMEAAQNNLTWVGICKKHVYLPSVTRVQIVYWPYLCHNYLNFLLSSL